MRLVDVNVLLYAAIVDYSQHKVSKAWLDDQLNGPTRLGLPWPSLLGFVRIASNPRLFPSPLAVEDAWSQVESWLEADTAWVPTPGPRHREVLAELVARTQPTGNLVMDAHLAALALEHGLIMVSTDRGFAQFPGLRWENPLD